jgi:hypothetical protein
MKMIKNGIKNQFQFSLLGAQRPTSNPNPNPNPNRAPTALRHVLRRRSDTCSDGAPTRAPTALRHVLRRRSDTHSYSFILIHTHSYSFTHSYG